MRTCPMWCYLPSVIFVGIAEKSLMPLDIFASKIKKSDAYQFSCRGSYQRRIDNLRKRFESLSGRRRWFSNRALPFQWCQDIPEKGIGFIVQNLKASAVSATTYMDGHVQEAAEERTWKAVLHQIQMLFFLGQGQFTEMSS